jgi:hypothetical protein
MGGGSRRTPACRLSYQVTGAVRASW